MATDEITCKGCAKVHDRLESFPGDLCLDCWAESPEGRRMPTADEVVRMWGGPVRRTRRTRRTRKETS